MIRLFRLLPPAGLMVLAACNQSPPAAKGTADGEILPGVSDAMLPIDSVRSQAPLAPRGAPTGKAGADSNDAAGPVSSEPAAAASSEAAPEPATPTPEAPTAE